MMPKSQIGFLKFLVQPIVKLFANYFEEQEDPWVGDLKANIEYWEEQMKNPSRDW